MEPLEALDAPCRAWHGHWIYCLGHCQRPTDVDDVFGAESVERIDFEGVEDVDEALQRLGLMASIGQAVLSYRQESKTS